MLGNNCTPIQFVVRSSKGYSARTASCRDLKRNAGAETVAFFGCLHMLAPYTTPMAPSCTTKGLWRTLLHASTQRRRYARARGLTRLSLPNLLSVLSLTRLTV